MKKKVTSNRLTQAGKLKHGQTTKRVLFRYNKPIKRGKSEHDGKEKIVVRSRRRISGDIIDKHIQDYNVWFLFLKLALELENQKAVLILKDRTKTRKDDSDGAEILKKRIKVNREFYNEWDLDEVLKLPFNKWLGRHRHLFTEEGITVLSTGDKIGREPDYLYVKINKNRRADDIIAQIRDKLPKDRKRHQSQSKFSIQKGNNPRWMVLMNKYNALLLKMMGFSDRHILDTKSGYMRLAHTSTKRKDKTTGAEAGYSLKDAGRTMYDLISGGAGKSYGAKQILLSVCDGYFVKNPTENYMDRKRKPLSEHEKTRQKQEQKYKRDAMRQLRQAHSM